MNIPMILTYLRPGEEWTLDGNEYAGLTWLSDTTKPTDAQLIAAWPAAQRGRPLGASCCTSQGGIAHRFRHAPQASGVPPGQHHRQPPALLVACEARTWSISEGNVEARVAMLQNELGRIWHMFRSVAGDKLLGLPMPHMARHDSYQEVVNGCRSEEPKGHLEPLLFDTFPRPEGWRL